MISAHFTSNVLEVKQKSRQTVDLMMGLMAADIEASIKTSGDTPFLHGGLRAHAKHIKNGVGEYTVIDDQEYAAAQEAGVTRGHQMKNYSTEGTGSHFMQKAIDKIKERQAEYAETAINATGGIL